MKKQVFIAIAVFIAFSFNSQDFEEIEILSSINPTEIPSFGQGPSQFVIESIFPFDIDSDGDLDLFYNDFNDYTIKLLENNGNNEFSVVEDFGNFEYAGYVQIADSDNDGNIELYINNTGGLIKYEQQNDFVFSSGELISGVDSGLSIKFGKFDGDNLLDLVAGSKVYQNLGNGAFQFMYLLDASTAIQFSLCDDYNNDGLDDIISNYLAVYTNLGSYNFNQTSLTAPWGEYQRVHTLADLNGDGNNEFYFTSSFDWSKGSVSALGGFEYVQNSFQYLDFLSLNTQPFFVSAIVIMSDSDFDGDGIKEVNFSYGDEFSKLNFGSEISLGNIGTLYEFDEFVRDYSTHDFDGDGDEDVIISYLDNKLIALDNQRIVCSSDNFTFQPTGQDVSFNGNQTSLGWDDYQHAVKCQIKGNKDIFPNDLSILVDVEPAQPLSFEKSISNLEPNTTYRWKVRCGCSVSPLIASSFSAYQYFTTPSFKGGESEMQLENSQLKTIANSEFEVYPNPSDGLFLLKQVKVGNQIEVINSMGQVVFSEIVSETPLSLDLSHLVDGNYQLQLRSGNTKKVKQIVLKH